MKDTIESATAAYAKFAHDSMRADGKAYVSQRFASVEEFVAFEMEGDASDEAGRLAKRFKVSLEEARQSLETALADIDLGYLNAAWRDDWIADTASVMAERDAEEWVSTCYDEEGFDPANASSCECETFQPELRAALDEAGFQAELTHADVSVYEDAFQARVDDLVAQRDREAIEAAVGTIVSEHLDRLYDLMAEAVDDDVPSVTKRLNEFSLNGIFHEVIEASLEAR